MVAPQKIVPSATIIGGGSGGGGAGSSFPSDRTNMYSNGGAPLHLSQPIPSNGPQPSGQFPAYPEPSFGAPCYGVYTDGNVRAAAYNQNPFSSVNVQPTSNPVPSLVPQVFKLKSQGPHLFSGGNAQPAPYPQRAFGQPAAYQQSPFGINNVHSTTCTQNGFCFPNQQSSGTSGQACATLFGPPAWGTSSQVSATSNPSSSSTFFGGGQAFVDNQILFGSRKWPYSSRTETDGKLTSISAMHVYSNKSHEELRSEDYQHEKSQGSSFPAAENSTNMSNRSFLFPAPLSSTTASQPSISESTSSPASGSSTVAPLSSVSASFSSPLFGTNTKPLFSVSANTSTLASEHSSLMPNQSCMFPAEPCSSAVQTAVKACDHFQKLPHPNGSSTVAPLSSVSASTSSSLCGTNTGPLSSVSVNAPTLASGHSIIMPNQICMIPVKPCFAFTCNRFQKLPHPNGINIREPDDSCVPKGLEVIVENLGFNPWSQGKDSASELRFPAVGGILSCVEADKDEDIISLAEFAVEQHKALHKDGCTGTLSKVVVACLEPFEGGRYHIVLDTTYYSGPGFLPPKRYYAVVLRKCSPHANYLTVLEKWLSS